MWKAIVLWLAFHACGTVKFWLAITKSRAITCISTFAIALACCKKLSKLSTPFFHIIKMKIRFYFKAKRFWFSNTNSKITIFKKVQKKNWLWKNEKPDWGGLYLYLSKLAFINQFKPTRMATQMIECYQFNCHFTWPQKR